MKVKRVLLLLVLVSAAVYGGYLVLVFVAGYGGRSGPDGSVLATGSEALTFSEDTGTVPFFGVGDSLGETGVELIPAGTKVRVIEDGSQPSKLRNVRVTPLEGKYEGKSGNVSRERLRPVEGK